MYKSYSYNNMPEPVIKSEPQQTVKKSDAPKENETSSNSALKNLFSSALGSDDIIILIIIIVLLLNDCNDKLLLLALAYIFLSGLEQ